MAIGAAIAKTAFTVLVGIPIAGGAVLYVVGEEAMARDGIGLYYSTLGAAVGIVAGPDGIEQFSDEVQKGRATEAPDLTTPDK